MGSGKETGGLTVWAGQGSGEQERRWWGKGKWLIKQKGGEREVVVGFGNAANGKNGQKFAKYKLEGNLWRAVITWTGRTDNR